MPIYEFKCSICSAVKEELVPMGTELSPTGCMQCLQPMKRQTSAVVGLVKGGTPKLTGCKADKNVSK